MAVKVGSLFIDMRASVARFAKDMRAMSARVRRSMRRIGSAVRRAARAFASFRGAVAAVAGVAGLGLLVRASLRATDRIGKLSRTFGIATRDLAAFRLAADLGGTSLDTFARAARTLAKNTFDFVDRGIGEAKDAFEALGLTAADVEPVMNDHVRLMGLVADRLNAMEDGAVKTALAYKLFGGRAIEILPALEGGAKALEGYRDEAERLGIAMSTRAVRGVEAANDAVTRLFTLFRGVRDQVVAALAPAIETLANFITNELVAAIKTSGGTVESWAGSVAVSILATIKQVMIGIERFANRAIKLANDVRRAFGMDPIEFRVVMPTATIDAMIAAIRRWGEVGATAAERVEAGMEDAKGAIEGVNTAAADAGGAFARFAEDAILRTRSLSEAVRALGRDIAGIVLRKTVTGPIGTAISDVIKGAFPGFQHGGSFTVAGAGGPDSQLVAFRATPGETVTVTPPGRGAGGPPAGPVVVINQSFALGVQDTVRAEFLNLRPVIRQDAVAAMVEAQRRNPRLLGGR